MLARIDAINILSDEDALALALVLGFNDEGDSGTTRFLLLDEIVQVEEFIGGDPCPWEEVVLVREAFLHEFQVFRQVMLESDQVHGGEMINDLMWLHPL